MWVVDSISSRFKSLSHIGALCRGEEGLLSRWITGEEGGSFFYCLVLIVAGCSAYGFTIGMRNGWEMALYVAIKLPAIIIITVTLNGLLNGMLSLLFGSGIGFLESQKFLLIGFALMSAILGSLSPISFFATINLPLPGTPGSHAIHGANLLLHTCLIAYGGIQAHARLLAYVKKFALTSSAGTRTFFGWLAGNLFVGAQVSWTLRPYFLTPGFQIEFLRPDLFDGNFYESVYRTFLRLFL